MFLSRSRPWVLRLGSLAFPLLVFTIAGYLYLHYAVYTLAWPLLFETPPGWRGFLYALELLLFTTVVALFLWSFVKTVLTHAGRTPLWFRTLYTLPQWHDVFITNQASISAGMVTQSAGGISSLRQMAGLDTRGIDNEDISAAQNQRANQRAPSAGECAVHEGVRWCAHCNAPKPIRAHHCTAMGECILRYDHYCPWVANAIGYYNYKFFVLFVLYAWLCCVWISLGFTPMMVTHHNLGGAKVDITWGASMAWVLALSFGVSLTLFGGLHLYFVYTANTSVEATFKRSRNMFDRGNKNNVSLVFGAIPRLWFVPVSTLDCALATAGGTYVYAHTVADVWAAAASARAGARLEPVLGEGASHVWSVQRAPGTHGGAGNAPGTHEETQGLLATADVGVGEDNISPIEDAVDSDDSAPDTDDVAPHLRDSGAEPAPVPEQAVRHSNQLLWHDPRHVTFDHRWWWWTACKFNPGVFVVNTNFAGPAVPRALRRQFRGGAPAPIIPEFPHPRIWQRIASRKRANAGAAVVQVGVSSGERMRASLRDQAARGQLGELRAPRPKQSATALRGMVRGASRNEQGTTSAFSPTETKAARGGAARAQANVSARPSGRQSEKQSGGTSARETRGVELTMGFAADEQLE